MVKQISKPTLKEELLNTKKSLEDEQDKLRQTLIAVAKQQDEMADSKKVLEDEQEELRQSVIGVASKQDDMLSEVKAEIANAKDALEESQEGIRQGAIGVATKQMDMERDLKAHKKSSKIWHSIILSAILLSTVGTNLHIAKAMKGQKNLSNMEQTPVVKEYERDVTSLNGISQANVSFTQTPDFHKHYVVKKGDTLSEIVKKFYGKYSLDCIKALSLYNKIDNVNKINVGDDLCILSDAEVQHLKNMGRLNFDVNNWKKSDVVEFVKQEEVKAEVAPQAPVKEEVVKDEPVKEVKQEMPATVKVQEEVKEEKYTDDLRPYVLITGSSLENIEEPVVNDASVVEKETSPVVEEKFVDENSSTVTSEDTTVLEEKVQDVKDLKPEVQIENEVNADEKAPEVNASEVEDVPAVENVKPEGKVEAINLNDKDVVYTVLSGKYDMVGAVARIAMLRGNVR